MRSLFYWIDSCMAGASILESMRTKVIYKMTTDEDEIALLEDSVGTIPAYSPILKEKIRR